VRACASKHLDGDLLQRVQLTSRPRHARFRGDARRRREVDEQEGAVRMPVVVTVEDGRGAASISRSSTWAKLATGTPSQSAGS
jgi:hypothetical protein